MKLKLRLSFSIWLIKSMRTSISNDMRINIFHAWQFLKKIVHYLNKNFRFFLPNQWFKLQKPHETNYRSSKHLQGIDKKNGWWPCFPHHFENIKDLLVWIIKIIKSHNFETSKMFFKIQIESTHGFTYLQLNKYFFYLIRLKEFCDRGKK